MKFKIGGFANSGSEQPRDVAVCEAGQETVARKSLVQVKFPGRGMALAYYNDRFDLKPGNRVYVSGKLEGQLGLVVEVNYNFKIKMADYQKVIARVDTEVHGEFYMAGSHFVTFDRQVLPMAQTLLWFKAPAKEDDEYASGNDDSAFPLEDLGEMKISAAIAQRGQEYYRENRVRYLCLDGQSGMAIVEGSENYVVEFEFADGMVGCMTCECPCGYPCKHEFAAMLQLRETLELIGKHYQAEYDRTGYFAAVFKGTLFTFAVDGQQEGKLVL